MRCLMKRSNDKSIIIEQLRKAEFVPYNVIGVLENRDFNVYFDDESGTVWAENEYFNYVYGDISLIKEKVASLETGFYGFSAVRGDIAEAIYRDYLLHWYEPTDRYLHMGQNFDELSMCPYELVSLSLDEAEGIDNRYEYQQEGSLEKIKDAIINRPTSAIYIDGELTSYVLVHEDNSIGYMFTLEKYRKHGLGYWVTLDILKKMQDKGSLSFVEINQKNYKSQGLAAKTGFVKDAFTPWFGIIKGRPNWFDEWQPFGQSPFMFTTLVHLRHVDQLAESNLQGIFHKIEGGYTFEICEENNKCATGTIMVDASDEAFVLKVEETTLSTYEILKVLVTYFPETQASIVLPYESELVGQIGCIVGLQDLIEKK